VHLHHLLLLQPTMDGAIFKPKRTIYLEEIHGTLGYIRELMPVKDPVVPGL